MTEYLGCRIGIELKELTVKVAKCRGLNTSSFIRYLLIKELTALGYLSAEVTKAFGLDVQQIHSKERT